MLSLVAPDVDPETHTYTTIFVCPGAQSKSAQKGKPKRNAAEDCVPVTIWPQYTVSDLEGRFVVVAPRELWMSTLLRAVRGRNATKNDDNTTRVLVRNFTQAMRCILRKILTNMQPNDESLGNVSSGEDDSSSTKRTETYGKLTVATPCMAVPRRFFSRHLSHPTQYP